MSTPPATEKTTDRGTLRDGFAVLGVAIRREPLIFTLSTLGSLLFGALTVADAWVLGWSTDHVVLPAFADGVVRPAGLWTILALFVAVALLRAVGIVARRLGAGVMQYRMQAHYRRAVTRQYLRLPMSWHQQHPTGQLLSNANSDVEAAWAPIAPLPMAVGTVAMMVIAVAQMLFTDLVLAVVGLLVFPHVIAVNVLYQKLQSPLMTRAQLLRAELSEVAHESFDGALVVKSLGRETEETERFARKAHQLRDVNVRAGRVRAAFDPVLEALPSLGVLAVLAVGVVRVDEPQQQRGQRGLAAGGGADHRDGPPGLDAEGQVLQQRRALGVVVGQPAHVEPGPLAGAGDLAGAVRHLAGRVEHRLHPPEADDAARELPDQPAERADREGHDREQVGHRDDVAGVRGAHLDAQHADRQHREDTEAGQRLEHRVEDGADPAGPDVHLAQGVRLGGEARGLLGLAAEALDHQRADEGLVGDLAELGAQGLRPGHQR